MPNGANQYELLHEGLFESDTLQQPVVPEPTNQYELLHEGLFDSAVDTFPFHESEEETIRRLSMSINADLPTIPHDEERTIGFAGRFFRRFADAAAPFPTGIASDIPEAADKFDTIADVAGSLIGFPIGFAIPGMIVGTGIGAPAGTAITAGKFAQFSKLINTLRNSSNVMRAAYRVGDIKKADAAWKTSLAASTELHKAGVSLKAMTSSGILRHTPGYSKALTKIATLGKESNKIAPKAAHAIDLGVKNFLTFNLYGQAKMPYESSLEDRMKQYDTDKWQSALFTVAGMPRIAGMKGFLKEATVGTKLSSHATESGLLLGIGMGSTDFLKYTGAIDKDTPDPTWEDRVIHGIGLVAFHYMRLGWEKANIKEKMEGSLVAMGVDPLIAKKLINRHGDIVADEVYKYVTKGRDTALQNRFINKKNKDDVVDLVGLFKPKVEGEKFTLVFDNVITGERTVIRAPEKEMLSNQFFNKYKRMAAWLKGGKFSFKPKEEEVPVKPPDEITKEVEALQSISKAASDALGQTRTSDVERISVSKVEELTGNKKVRGWAAIEKGKREFLKKAGIPEGEVLDILEYQDFKHGDYIQIPEILNLQSPVEFKIKKPVFSSDKKVHGITTGPDSFPSGSQGVGGAKGFFHNAMMAIHGGGGRRTYDSSDYYFGSYGELNMARSNPYDINKVKWEESPDGMSFKINVYDKARGSRFGSAPGPERWIGDPINGRPIWAPSEWNSFTYAQKKQWMLDIASGKIKGHKAVEYDEVTKTYVPKIDWSTGKSTGETVQGDVRYVMSNRRFPDVKRKDAPRTDLATGKPAGWKRKMNEWIFLSLENRNAVENQRPFGTGVGYRKDGEVVPTWSVTSKAPKNFEGLKKDESGNHILDNKGNYIKETWLQYVKRTGLQPEHLGINVEHKLKKVRGQIDTAKTDNINRENSQIGRVLKPEQYKEEGGRYYYREKPEDKWRQIDVYDMVDVVSPGSDKPGKWYPTTKVNIDTKDAVQVGAGKIQTRYGRKVQELERIDNEMSGPVYGEKDFAGTLVRTNYRDRDLFTIIPEKKLPELVSRFAETKQKALDEAHSLFAEPLLPSSFDAWKVNLHHGKHKDTYLSDIVHPPKIKRGRFFSTEREAIEFAEKYWTGEAGTDYLRSKIGFNDKTIEQIDSNESWKNYKNLVSETRRKESKIGLEADESEFFRKQLAPNSEGKLENMSPNELEAYKTMLEGSENMPSINDLYNNNPPPPGFMNNVAQRLLNSKMWLKEKAIPYTVLLRSLKSKYLDKWADMVDYHSLDRQYIAAKGIVFRDEMLSTFPDLKVKDFGKLTAHLDSKFDVFKDTGLVSRVGSENIKKIRRAYRSFTDDLFIDMVEAGVEVRVVYGKEGASYNPLFKVYDKEGNPINIHPDVFTFNPDKPTVRRGKHIFEIINKKRTKIKSITGEEVEIDTSLTKHNYVRDYVTRLITKDMKSYMGRDDFYQYLKEELVRNDPELQDMILAAEKTRDPNARARAVAMATEEAFQIASYRINDLNAYLNSALPSGTQYVRTAHLPPVIYLNNRGAPIRILKSQINVNIKKGSKLRDKYGKDHVVAKVIDVYERDLGIILDRYMSNISQIIPTYKYFGRGGVDSELSKFILHGAVGEFKGNATLIKDWVLPYAKAAINGSPSTFMGRLWGKFVGLAAKLGLSSPRSGEKNVILGNVQNFSTYATINFMEGWSKFLAKPTTYKKMTIKTGALQVSVHELLAGKTWRFDTGFMRKTEHLNRYTSVATGNLVFDHALARLAFPEHYKNFANLRMSQSRANHLMKHLFGYKDSEVITMVEVLRDAIDYSKLESNHHGAVRDAILHYIPLSKGRVTVHKGTENERIYNVSGKMQALQNAHLKTQGGPSLSTMPGWLTRDWARPLTLFYRVAYNVTNNVLSNVVKPLQIDGNPFPMLRYVPTAILAGYHTYWIYFNVLDKKVINRFQDRDWDYWDYFVRGEGLGIGSNSFEEHGGRLSPYVPAIWELGKSIYNEITAMVNGTKTWKQSFADAVKSNYVLANDVIEIAKSTGIVNYLGKNWEYYDIIKDRSEEKRRQTQFEETYFAKDRKFDEHDIFLTTRSPFYRTISDVFWASDQRIKAKAYYSAIQYIVDEMQKNAPNVMTSRPRAEKLAERYVNSVISKQMIVPEAWKKRDKGERISRYDFYISKLTPAEKKEIKELEALYKYQQMQWKRAKIQYKNEYYFKDRKWERTY